MLDNEILVSGTCRGAKMTWERVIRLVELGATPDMLKEKALLGIHEINKILGEEPK